MAATAQMVVPAPAASPAEGGDGGGKEGKPKEKKKVLKGSKIYGMMVDEEEIPKPKGDYTVFVAKKSLSTVGLDMLQYPSRVPDPKEKWSVQDGGGLVVRGIKPDSLIGNWNKIEPNDFKVQIGDRVVCVNEQWKSTEDMMKELQTAQTLHILFDCPKIVVKGDVSVRLSKAIKDKSSFGLVVEKDRRAVGLDVGFLSVKEIKPGSFMESWNRQNPATEVRPGDRVLDVNGESKSADKMLNILNVGPVVAIEIRRIIDKYGERMRAEAAAAAAAAEEERKNAEEEAERQRLLQEAEKKWRLVRAQYDEEIQKQIHYDKEQRRLAENKEDEERAKKEEQEREERLQGEQTPANAGLPQRL